jgi:xylan 1,4-beta-xylosidase
LRRSVQISTFYSTKNSNTCFATCNGTEPDVVKDFIVLRTEKDKRSGWLKWRPVNNAYAYNIYYGTAPDKLNNCIMVLDNNENWFKGMDKLKTYYFSVEAVNENGISERTKLMEVK